MVICLERGADLHMAQLMPLPLTVSCFSKIQIGFAFLVPAHPGSPGQRAVKRVFVCLFVCLVLFILTLMPLLSTLSFYSFSILISSSSVSAITAKSSAYSSSHGRATLNSLDMASMTITNNNRLNPAH